MLWIAFFVVIACLFCWIVHLLRELGEYQERIRLYAAETVKVRTERDKARDDRDVCAEALDQSAAKAGKLERERDEALRAHDYLLTRIKGAVTGAEYKQCDPS